MGTVKKKRAKAPEGPVYYVYIVAIGGVIRYVGKGSGWRKNRHANGSSHNPVLKELIAQAEAEGVSVKTRILKDGLTKTDALRLEGQCYEKWYYNRAPSGRLCNTNHPYPALEQEREEEEYEQLDASGAFDDFKASRRALDAMCDYQDGLISREEAIALGAEFGDDHVEAPDHAS